MRISGGKARGIPLRIDRNSGIRPALEPARERLFSALAHCLPQARTLDLFAGSGAYGLEALSRGAAETTLVEKNRKAFANLEKNLEAVTRSAQIEKDRGKLLHCDAVDFLAKNAGPPYDLVFVDPPYSELELLCPKVFSLLREGKLIEEKGLVILEGPAERTMEFPHWKLGRTIGKEKRGSPVHRIYHPLFVDQ